MRLVPRQSHLARREATEDILQEHLRYKIRKPFVKYLDEYNWHVAVGRSYARATDGAARTILVDPGVGSGRSAADRGRRFARAV